MVENKKQSIFSELIEKIPEKITTDFEIIATNTEKIPEKIRYRGERGPDKAPRIRNLNSLANLKQNRNKILVKTGSNDWIWILVGIAIAIAIGIILWKIYEWWEEKQDK